MSNSAARAITAARECESLAFPSGLRSLHNFTGGSPTVGVRRTGRSASGNCWVRSNKSNHSVVGAFVTRVLRLMILENSSTFAGRFVAISTRTSSLKILPGAISISRAKSSRACQSALMMARVIRSRTLCIPEVRRHGSTRGGGAGFLRIWAKSSKAHSSFPRSRNKFSTSSRKSTNTSTSRAA